MKSIETKTSKYSPVNGKESGDAVELVDRDHTHLEYLTSGIIVASGVGLAALLVAYAHYCLFDASGRWPIEELLDFKQEYVWELGDEDEIRADGKIIDRSTRQEYLDEMRDEYSSESELLKSADTLVFDRPFLDEFTTRFNDLMHQILPTEDEVRGLLASKLVDTTTHG